VRRLFWAGAMRAHGDCSPYGYGLPNDERWLADGGVNVWFLTHRRLRQVLAEARSAHRA